MREHRLVMDTPSFPISWSTKVIPDELPGSSTQTNTCTTLLSKQIKQKVIRILTASDV